MKFINGYWLDGIGYKNGYAAQAYEVEVRGNKLVVLATSQVIKHRGQTLGGPNLEITYSSTAKDIIKVHIAHYKGGLDNAPKFELNEEQGFVPQITDAQDFAELVSGNTRVRIEKGEKWEVGFFRGEERLTGCSWRSSAYVEEAAGKARQRVLAQEEDYFFDYPADPRSTYIVERLDLGVGECIYGFGEKFTTFVKNGQTVEVWNADGGTCTEQSYKTVPFYISSSGYGILVNSSDKVSFEVGSEIVSRVSFSQPGEEMEYFIIGGENPKAVLENYTGLTGRPGLPPAYSFGLWLSTSFTTDYNEETVNSFIDGMFQRDIPLQVFHFDCFWMKEHEWCNFEWDIRQFPDPQAMLDRLREKGLEICVWINPYIGQRSKLFEEGKEKGYFLKKQDGGVFQTDFWQPGMAIVDFTNPEACRWYAGLLKNLMKMGIRNLKTDFGERIPSDVVYHSGKDPIAMHNYFTYLYNKTVAEALAEVYGENNTCLFSRSATVGGQKYPVHWGGDCFASYSAMAETLRAGLSLCSSGFGFFSHDIGGFEATASPDLYKRWCAFGLMSTHSRLHGSSSYRVPWLFDDEASEVLSFYTKLKGRLMPYLYTQAVKTHQTGIPMMRSMVVEFPGDPVCKHLDTQYMLGDSLLIAPVMNERGIAEFYLPKGRWTDIVTGDVYEGERYVTRECSYTEMPILAREGAIIGFGHFDKSVVYDYVEGAEFVLYGMADGVTATAVVYDSEANKVLTLTAACGGGEVKVTGDAAGKSYKVRLAGNTDTAAMDGGSAVIAL
ncbi:MAG: alpha-xylosidase [Oscillospiraceae bacterium]